MIERIMNAFAVLTNRTSLAACYAKGLKDGLIIGKLAAQLGRRADVVVPTHVRDDSGDVN